MDTGLDRTYPSSRKKQFALENGSLRLDVSAEQFDKRVRAVLQQKPSWFLDIEPPPTEKDISQVENVLKLALPEQFKHFARTFGAGYFGKSNISSLSRSSEWYVLSRPKIIIDREPMLIVSDDEAGGFYGFVSDGLAYGTKVFYAHPGDGNYLEDVALSFFDYIQDFALDL